MIFLASSISSSAKDPPNTEVLQGSNALDASPRCPNGRGIGGAKSAHGGYTFVVPPEGIGTCGVRLPRDERPVRRRAETSGVARTFEYFMRLNSSRTAWRNCFPINRQVSSALAVHAASSSANNPEWRRERLENREDRDAIANIDRDFRSSGRSTSERARDSIKN